MDAEKGIPHSPAVSSWTARYRRRSQPGPAAPPAKLGLDAAAWLHDRAATPPVGELPRRKDAWGAENARASLLPQSGR